MMFTTRNLQSAFARLSLVALAVIVLLSCGGDSGTGPDEIKESEERLKRRLPIDWTQYNDGDLERAINFFTATLDVADGLEGVEAVRNEVKAEAQNGIGWSFMSQQQLDDAERAFSIATTLNRRNADAWVGWTGVSLAQRDFGDVVQFAKQALEAEPDYDSATRVDSDGRSLGHDDFDVRHVRLMLSEAYFHLGRYSVRDQRDPDNAAAQLSLVNRSYRFQSPGQLLDSLSVAVLSLQKTVSTGL